MKVLVIGGTRFLGVHLTWRLLGRGHQVTLLNRGRIPDPFGPRVERLTADRGTDAFDDLLAGRKFDAVVDLALYTADEARRTVKVLLGNAGHYLMISTGQVYLVRDGYRWPAREDDYPGPVIPPPTDADDFDDWKYGVDKRAAEDVLAASSLPVTRIRVPMVHGVGDYHRRIEGYLWRLLDGAPVLIANPLGPARHVYAPAVAEFICDHLGDGRTFGEAFNLAQDEALTVKDWVEKIAACAGSRSRLQTVSREDLVARGLEPTHVSPFSGTWMSCLDSTKAKVTLGFRHPPMEQWLPGIVHTMMSRPGPAPEGYARRKEEQF